MARHGTARRGPLPHAFYTEQVFLGAELIAARSAGRAAPYNSKLHSSSEWALENFTMQRETIWGRPVGFLGGSLPDVCSPRGGSLPPPLSEGTRTRRTSTNDTNSGP